MGRPATCQCGVCPKCRRREYIRAYYREHPERRTKYGPAQRAYEHLRYHSDPEYRFRKKARNAVCIRVARGTMTPEPCSLCGSSWGVCAHHNDYTRPLDVTWLCSEHHDMVHGPLPGV